MYDQIPDRFRVILYSSKRHFLCDFLSILKFGNHKICATVIFKLQWARWKKWGLLGYKGLLIIEFHEHWTCNASEFRMRQLLFSSSQLSVKENNTSGHGIQLITDYITARACTRAWNTFFSILFKKSKQWYTSAESLTLTAEQLFAKFLDETLWLLQIFLSYKRTSNAKLYNHFSRPFLRLQCVWYIGGKIIQVKQEEIRWHFHSV